MIPHSPPVKVLPVVFYSEALLYLFYCTPKYNFIYSTVHAEVKSSSGL